MATETNKAPIRRLIEAANRYDAGTQAELCRADRGPARGRARRWRSRSPAHHAG